MDYESSCACMTREELLPPEVRAALPPLNAITEGGEHIARVSFYYFDYGWTWYGIAFDGDDLFYGLIDCDKKWLGYFELSEMLQQQEMMGEFMRDTLFTPTPVRQLMLD